MEGPSARRRRRELAQRRRRTLALLAIAVGHWAYHKNRAWNDMISELTYSRPYADELDIVTSNAASSPATPARIDLTSPAAAGADVR